MAFVVEDVLQTLIQMQSDFDQDLSQVDDDHLAQLKTESQSITNRLETISKKYETLLQIPIKDSKIASAVKTIGEKYVKINNAKQGYIKSISDESSSRELDKNKQFNKAIQQKTEKVEAMKK